MHTHIRTYAHTHVLTYTRTHARAYSDTGMRGDRASTPCSHGPGGCLPPICSFTPVFTTVSRRSLHSCAAAFCPIRGRPSMAPCLYGAPVEVREAFVSAIGSWARSWACLGRPSRSMRSSVRAHVHAHAHMCPSRSMRRSVRSSTRSLGLLYIRRHERICTRAHAHTHTLSHRCAPRLARPRRRRPSGGDSDKSLGCYSCAVCGATKGGEVEARLSVRILNGKS